MEYSLKSIPAHGSHLLKKGYQKCVEFYEAFHPLERGLADSLLLVKKPLIEIFPVIGL